MTAPFNLAIVIDDDPDIALAARLALRDLFAEVATLARPDGLLGLLVARTPDAILFDLNFARGQTDGSEGLGWLPKISAADPDVAIVVITAHGGIDIAVEAIRRGATDFVSKPWANARLAATVRSAAALTRSRRAARTEEGRAREVAAPVSATPLLGNSAAMARVHSLIARAAPTEANVLILGENGTGKELVAREIHRRSRRAGKPMVAVDLGAVTESLFEAELFGHAKGAFTDARADRIGRMQAADGSTLFLDEIGNLPLHLQPKLLTALEQREVTPVGTNRAVGIDVRIVAATNIGADRLHDESRFRQDLLFRLNTVEIELPPLRARGEDIIPLLEHYLDVYARKYEKPARPLRADAVDRVMTHDWPGNVRALRHAAERAVILAEGETLTADDFALARSALPSPTSLPADLNLDRQEKQMIERALKKHHYNISLAATELGLSRGALYRRMKSMEFRRRFELGLAWRALILLAAFALLVAAAATPGLAAARIVAALLALWALTSLWSHIRRTNFEVARFIEALRFDDFSQRFASPSGGGFDVLGEALDRAMKSLRDRRTGLSDDVRYLSAIIDDAPVALLSIADGGKVEMLNKAARQFFDRAAVTQVADFEAYGAELSAAIGLPPGGRRVTRIMLDGIALRVILATARVERLGAGLTVASMLPVQAELGQVEMTTQADLVRVLTHEIMNSLTPVISLARSAAELVASAKAENPALSDAHNAVETLAARADGIARFVESYRDFAFAPNLRRRRFQARSWAGEIVAIAVADPKIAGSALTTSIDPANTQIDGDANLLSQVMLNLIRNSALAKAGNVELRVRSRRGGRVQIEVADDGPGIPIERREDVFMPFYTTRKDGSGVGLSFARQIVLAHGGSIAADQSDLGGREHLDADMMPPPAEAGGASFGQAWPVPGSLVLGALPSSIRPSLRRSRPSWALRRASGLSPCSLASSLT